MPFSFRGASEPSATLPDVTWFYVWLDGAGHGCELPADDPPLVGQVRDRGGVVARVDEVLEGADGKPLIRASRVTRQPRTLGPP